MPTSANELATGVLDERRKRLMSGVVLTFCTGKRWFPYQAAGRMFWIAAASAAIFVLVRNRYAIVVSTGFPISRKAARLPPHSRMAARFLAVTENSQDVPCHLIVTNYT